MRNVLIGLAVWAALAGSAAAAEGEWQPSVLKPETIEKVYGATNDYHRCMGEEIGKDSDPGADPRAIADAILKTCEVRLNAMREAFIGEGVPEAIADRYLRKTRTQAANSLLRETMALQAQRQNAAAP